MIDPPHDNEPGGHRRLGLDSHLPTIMVPAGATIVAAGAETSADEPILGGIVLFIGAGLMVSAAWPLANKWLPKLGSVINERFPSRTAKLNLFSSVVLAVITMSLLYALVSGRQDGPGWSSMPPGAITSTSVPTQEQTPTSIPPEDSSDRLAADIRTHSCEADHVPPDMDGDVGSTRLSLDSVPMFRNGPAHPGAVTVSDAPSELRQRWSFSTFGEVFSSPAVAGGRVYFGSVDDSVYAVDIETGEQLWRAFTLGSVKSSPAVVDGIVFVGSTDGFLYALGPWRGGAKPPVKWMFESPGAINSSPTVVDDLVYFGTGAIDDHLSGGYIVAVDVDTGKQRWCVRTDDAILSSPAVVDGTLFVGSWDSHLYALDSLTGEERWPPFKTKYEIFSSPSVVDGVVYFGSYDGSVYALSAKTGEPVWPPFFTGDLVYSSPAVHDGAVYIASWTGHLYRLDAETGEELDEPIWIGGQERSEQVEIRSSPTIAGDMLYIGSRDHHLYAINLSSWTIVDKIKLGGEVRSSPVVVDGVIYVGTTDNRLYAIESADSGTASQE